MNKPYNTSGSSSAHTISTQIQAVKQSFCAELGVPDFAIDPPDEVKLEEYRQYGEYPFLAIYILDEQGKVDVARTASMWYETIDQKPNRDEYNPNTKSSSLVWKRLSLVEEPSDMKVVELKKCNGGTRVRLGYRWVSLDINAYAGASVQEARETAPAESQGNYQLAGLEPLMLCVYYWQQYYARIQDESAYFKKDRYEQIDCYAFALAGLSYDDYGIKKSVAIKKPYGQRFHIGTTSVGVAERWVTCPLVETVAV